jgi:hypothetical protein
MTNKQQPKQDKKLSLHPLQFEVAFYPSVYRTNGR